MNRNEIIKTVWTVGTELNWFGKLFIYTVGLPFLCLYTFFYLLFYKGPK